MEKGISRRSFLAFSSVLGFSIGMTGYIINDLYKIPLRIADLASQSPLEQKIEENYSVNIIGWPTQKELTILEGIMQEAKSDWDNFDRQMQVVRAIYIGKPFIVQRDGNNKEKNNQMEIVGQADSINHMIILNELNPNTYIHELAHEFNFFGPNMDNFNRAWQPLCTEEYLDTLKKVEATYSHYNRAEDIAEITEAIFDIRRIMQGRGVVNPYDLVTKVVYAGGRDILVEKFQLLEDYHFISPHEHKLALSYI